VSAASDRLHNHARQLVRSELARDRHLRRLPAEQRIATAATIEPIVEAGAEFLADAARNEPALAAALADIYNRTTAVAPYESPLTARAAGS